MAFPPAVVIHRIEDARIALAPGVPVTLLSGPAAALYAGCGFWRALIGLCCAEYPDARAPDILDCADASGYALAALRLGQPALVLASDAASRAAVAAIAAETGAVLLATRPPALDLAVRGAARHLADWLCGPTYG